MTENEPTGRAGQVWMWDGERWSWTDPPEGELERRAKGWQHAEQARADTYVRLERLILASRELLSWCDASQIALVRSDAHVRLEAVRRVLADEDARR